MLDQVEIENARFPLLKWLGIAMGIAMLIACLVSMLPLSETWRHGLESAGQICGIAMAAFIPLFFLFQAITRAQTLKHGEQIEAMVIHRRRIVWGSGTGGQSWRLTLRYTISGQTYEAMRSVSEDEFNRAKLDAMVAIAVSTKAPMRWHLLPRQKVAQKSPATCPSFNRIGALAYLLHVSIAMVVLIASDARAQGTDALLLIYCTSIGLVALFVAWKWWLGEGRVAGPIFLCYTAVFILAPMVITQVEISFKAMLIASWIAAAVVIYADIRARMELSKDVPQHG